MPKKRTIEEFEELANKVHNGKYTYHQDYVNNKKPILIKCPIHGDFLQRPDSHLQGKGCRLCGIEKNSLRLTSNTKEFITKSNKIHKDRYDYSKVEYKNNRTKVCIICPQHGYFWQTPNMHLLGQGCPKCCGSYKENTNSFIKKANKIHNNRYNYSKVEYIDSKTKVCIICPKHGEFWQTPNMHLRGNGCSKCAGKYHYTTEEWIEEAKKVHKGNKYDYTKVAYTGAHTKISIICKKHGEFLQFPYVHLNGCGCPKCNTSKLEQEIRNLLLDNNIQFEEQKKFPWLGLQSLDFYLPNYCIAIECQGLQHFEAKEHFGGKESLAEIKKRDEIKMERCITHSIELLYYANYKYNFPYSVITDKEELIQKINPH